MDELPLKNRIERYLKNHPDIWFHGEDITKLAQSVGYEGESGRRCLRKLVEDKIAITESRKGKRTRSNWYKLNTEIKRVVYNIPAINKQITLFA